MSLINDALKRAEEDKRRNGNGPESFHGLPAIYNNPPKRRIQLVEVVIVVFAVSCAAVLGFGFFTDTLGGFWARPSATTEATVTPAEPSAPKAVSNGPVWSEGMSGDCEQAFAKTEQALTYHVPAKVAARRNGIEPEPSPACDDMKESRPTLPTHPTPQGGPNAAASQAEQEVPVGNRIDPADFELNGIMYSPGASTAIINGKLVQAGEIVDGAEVLQIDRRQVQLQAGSRQFSLRM